MGSPTINLRNSQLQFPTPSADHISTLSCFPHMNLSRLRMNGQLVPSTDEFLRFCFSFPTVFQGLLSNNELFLSVQYRQKRIEHVRPYASLAIFLWAHRMPGERWTTPKSGLKKSTMPKLWTLWFLPGCG